ncbi:MAG: patatin-like phospholipase family protein [Candidatus Limnocylindrales bacterium]
MGTALVLAGGGVTGIAWEAGVLAGLAAGGVAMAWDLVVGTSAGAYVGARLTCDGSPAPLFAIQTSGNDAEELAGLRALFGAGFVRAVQLSRRRSLRWVGWAWLTAFVATTFIRLAVGNGIRATWSIVRTLGPGRSRADPLDLAIRTGVLANTKVGRSTALIEHWEHALGSGRAWPAGRLMITAIDTHGGSRALFDRSSGVSLVEAVAASTCLPGLVPPIELLGRRFMDGGIISPANADVAGGAPEVWIVCPVGAASLGREIAQLRSTGSMVRLIRPSTEARASLPGGLGEFDPRRRRAAATAGFADGQRFAEAMAGPPEGPAGPLPEMRRAGLAAEPDPRVRPTSWD